MGEINNRIYHRTKQFKRFVKWVQSNTPDFNPDRFIIKAFYPYEIESLLGGIRDIGSGDNRFLVIGLGGKHANPLVLVYKVIERFNFEDKIIYLLGEYYENNV